MVQARWLVLALALAGCQMGMIGAEVPDQAEPAMSPGKGFFSGGDDVRGRTENKFGRALDHGDTTAETGNAPADAPARKMIQRGTIGVAVARVDDAVARFVAQVQGLGGYLAERTDARVTCRLPAARFDEAFAALREYGRVTHESIEAQDVTKQHMDLGIRLDNARRARERLLSLLEKAIAVKDLLEIEGALRRLTEEIERMEGELKYLEDQVAMATLTAEFQAVVETSSRGRAPMSRFPWINQVGVEQVRRAF